MFDRFDERGLVGIGTVIIFIALLIVSSISAVAIINASVSFRRIAETTADRTGEKVASGVDMVDAKGQTDDNGYVENIYLIVRPFPGGEIDLTQTVIQYRSPYEVNYLRENQQIGVLDNLFRADPIQDEGGKRGVMSSTAEIYKVIIRLETGDKLEPGQSADLTFVPGLGFETTYLAKAPADTAPNSWYIL